MLCEIGLKQIAKIPAFVQDILDGEALRWNYNQVAYHYDRVFGYHKSLAYHVGSIDQNIKYEENINPVVNWLESKAGTNYKVVRCFLNLIEPNSSFRLHVDTLKVHKLARRFHIPITNVSSSVYLTYSQQGDCWKETKNYMQRGFLYELDNIRPHNVINDSEQYRINFIADVIDSNLIGPDLTTLDDEQFQFLNYIFNNGLKIIH